MIAYASRTGTRRNLDAMRAAGWHLLVVAGAVLRHEGFPYALDNGAWSCFQRGVAFDEGAFLAALEALGTGAEFVVVPDIVAGGLDSLKFSEQWLPRLEGVGCRRLVAVQDGMAPWDVEPLLGPAVGIFVGGSTEWKWGSLPYWAALARRRRCYLHVGRVNTANKIRECARVGADSFDGTSATRFAVTLPMLDAQRRQPALLPDDCSDRCD